MKCCLDLLKSETTFGLNKMHNHINPFDDYEELEEFDNDIKIDSNGNIQLVYGTDGILKKIIKKLEKENK